VNLLPPDCGLESVSLQLANQCRRVRRKREERLFWLGRSDADAELSSVMSRLGRTTSLLGAVIAPGEHLAGGKRALLSRPPPRRDTAWEAHAGRPKAEARSRCESAGGVARLIKAGSSGEDSVKRVRSDAAANRGSHASRSPLERQH